MVWTYEFSCPALTKHAKTSESTILGGHSLGTLHDGTYVDTTCPTNQLGIVTTVSTHSTKRSSTTYLAIPTTSWRSTNTTMLTYNAVDLSISTTTNTPQSDQAPKTDNNEATRIYGFDLSPHWQEDRDHYDNQKISGLTLPRSIRQSAFTQKLDIEGCDPLSLPLAALMTQQAKSHWLRKLAHGREVVKYIWSRQGTLLRWCSRRNFGLSSETVASTWTGSHIFEPDRMGNCWTRRQTPSMLHNKSQNGSKDGHRPGPRIPIPKMRSAPESTGYQRKHDTSATRSIQFKPRCNSHPTGTHEQLQHSCSTGLWTSMPTHPSHHN